MERNGNNRSGSDGLWRSSSDPSKHNTTSSSPANDFVLQWGNRKRLRCMKFQSKQVDPSKPVHLTTVRTDRRVVRSTDTKQQTSLATTNTTTTPHHHHTNVNGNGLLNLRQRPPSPPHRVLRNSEASGAMRSHHHSNGATTDRGSQDKKSAHVSNSHHNNHTIEINNKSGASSETAAKGGGGSSSGSGDADAAAAAMTWPPKFVIGLTNKEKEEDFLAIKGSKLPQRPKKRAKFIQRTVNLVCPGTWLCDLTLERYEVREKKVSKKRPRGLKAMGNMIDSDSE